MAPARTQPGHMTSHALAQLSVDADGPIQLRRNLVRQGVAADWIRRRVACGDWVEIFPGVLWAGLDPPTEAARLAAALAYAGPEAALARGSALHLWLGTPLPGHGIDITVPHGRTRRRATGIVLHQRTHHNIVTWRGFPVSSVPQTMVDLIGHAGLHDVRCQAAEAVRRRLMRPDGLLAGTAVRRNVTATARMLDEELRAGALSGGECAFYRLVRSAGLPPPLLNVPIDTGGGRYVLDAYWECLRLVVEVDGRSVHAKQAAFEADAERQNHLHIAGLLVIRFPVSMVFNQPEQVRAILEEAMRARAAELGLTWAEVRRRCRVAVGR